MLLSGMFARIKVELFSKRDALIIPTEAIVKGEEGETFVFLLNEEKSTVSKVRISVGYERSDYSQINGGIEKGQIIAVTSLDQLKDGNKVNVIEKQTLEL